jgi:hypothetical protein
VRRWIRLNSFAARMLGRSWTGLGLLHLAIWELRDTFEEDVDEVELATRVTIALEWISQAGSVLFDKFRNATAENSDGTSIKPGKLYKGSSSTTLERWAFWKQRLSEIGTKKGGVIATETLAAVRIMEDIEKRYI